MQLFRTESSEQSDKIVPRAFHLVSGIGRIYLALTVLCAILYGMVEMSVFDAVNHAMTTVSTGGYSTHDASIGYFGSAAVELVTIVLMVLGGTSFSLHFLAWRYRHIGDYWRDEEFRAYVAILLAITLVTTVVLVLTGEHADPAEAVRSALFHAVSVQTSTGFTTEDFSVWPGVLPTLLIFASFVGGCAGSTGGGMKVIRWLLVTKQGSREVSRLIHPSAEVVVKLGGRPIDARVIEAVWGFFAIYLVVFTLLMLALMGTGVDQITAFGAIATCMNNLGPGLGEVATNFQSMNPAGEWLCTLAMLLGRLEIFPLLVLVSPGFWRG
jgi:trk system potassium uptake protein TrkH